MLTKKRITYIVSNINKALAFEWVVQYLSKDKFELSFILLNPGDSVLESFLIKHTIPFIRISYHGKKDLPGAISQIRQFLKKNQTEVIHCHLFDANVAGLIAARLTGIKKRIFTRHHATFHHQYFPRAVWYDRFINRMASDIIAISENVRHVLIEKEKVNPNKITLIHHGFELEKFRETSEEKVNKLKDRYKTLGKYPVIGVISRYFELKGIQYIIPAFKSLLSSFPNAHLVLANATGNYKQEIEQLLQTLPPDSYTEVPFEEDLFSLYQIFDIFIHVPINTDIEAFGQTYVEALAAGIPSVFTLSGIATEFIQDGQNALVVPFKDANSITEACLKILSSEDIHSRLVSNGHKSVVDKFSIQRMIAQLEKLYLCE
ncbi:glycosyltransferase family 4 protein [Cytophagaceae bacterium YF14B1]|uniref:Glycosyltransferase family 4 protein n=1 Tax=Xanthocytophaga flava TaxID=3048013 RepID=A0AAE3U9C0_9BACT|nr:glycosyltransferase family 4 protein [Xanthocytophaga flavus]MDJ1483527.1 glycosyltransferase family 4 protein [Xanthocytophaga flavus]